VPTRAFRSILATADLSSATKLDLLATIIVASMIVEILFLVGTVRYFKLDGCLRWRFPRPSGL